MRVSIVIPIYNKEPFVAEAIQSVLAQTFQDFEIVIIDDGSTDGSLEVVQAVSDERFRIIRRVNGGAAAARNTGIEAAQGEWIAFLDADDIWFPDSLKVRLAILERNPSLNWCAGLHRRRTTNGEILRSPVPTILHRAMTNDVVTDALAILPYALFFTSTVMVKKRVFDEIGLMDMSLRTAEDIDMWLRIALRYPRLGFSLEEIGEYRFRLPGSLSAQDITVPQSLPHFVLVRKHLPTIFELQSSRRKLVHSLCCRFVEIGVQKLLLSGFATEALKILHEFKQVLGRVLYYRYCVLAMMPSGLLKTGFRAKGAMVTQVRKFRTLCF